MFCTKFNFFPVKQNDIKDQSLLNANLPHPFRNLLSGGMRQSRVDPEFFQNLKTDGKILSANHLIVRYIY